MKRHFLILCVLVLTAQFSWGGSVTPPANLPAYYSTYINNKSASTLFTGIHNVAKVGYSSLTYNGLWTAYATTDVYPAGHAQAGNIWDMYGGCTFIYSSNQCGVYSKECDCYNREHSIPKSWFGSSESANTPGTDIFHVVPTDGKVNGTRSNYAFGEVTSASYSYNGSKLGTPNSITIANSILGEAETTKLCSSSPVFEPIDEYKGDFARGYLGAMVRWASGDYQTFTSGDGGQIFNTAYDASHYYGLTQYGVALLLKWHRQDPVSQKEIDRNNGIQTTQGNRNPFIDYPILVEYIWGKYSGETFLLDNAVGSFESAFEPGVSDGDKNGGSSISQTYYASLNNRSGSSLRSALTVLLYNHHIYYDKYDGSSSGSQNWDFPFDYDSNGYVWDIYTQNCQMRSDIGSTQSCCCSGLNREHLVCQSTFGGSPNKDKVPQYADRHSLFLTDARTNQIRNDQPFGEVDMSDPSKVNNGNGSNCTNCTDHALGNKGPVSADFSELYDSSEDVYEPGDVYKGDIARAIMYMVVRYAERTYCRLPDGARYNNSTTGVGDVVNSSLTTANNYSVTDWKNAGTSTASTIGQMFSTDLSVNYGLSDYGKAVLLKWHRQDPVSQKEIDRNTGVESVQGNRNPFVDYPYLVEYLWGDHAGETVNLTNLVGSFEDAFVPGASDGSKNGCTITWSVNGITSMTQVENGTRPTPPSVENCTATRVFKGWTTSNNYSGNGSDLMKVQSDFPQASAATTYYAVFANKEGSGSDDDYELYSGSLTEGDYIIYYSDKAMKASVTSSSRLDYSEVTPANNKISTTDASIIWHIAPSGNYWTIYNEGVNKYAAGTGAKNKAQLLDSGADDKSLWTCLPNNLLTKYDFINKANEAAGVNDTLRNNGTYGFACYAAGTGGALSLYKAGESATYSNYGTACSTVPQVTITFHKNDGSSTTTTQQVPQNTATALTANPWTRTHYTFQGWATSADGAKVYNDQQNVSINATLDLYAVWKEDDKYTVTWHTSEGSTPVEYYSGTNLALPDTPDDCEANVRVFEGWTSQNAYRHESEKPNDLFTTASGTVTANADYYAVYADKETIHEPILVTDSLTSTLINQSSYGDWSGKTSYSNAIYAGNSTTGYSAIQMRGSSNSGIVTTTTGGSAKKVVLKWNSNTANSRYVDVYGKTSAYSSAADLYSTEAATQGTKLGTITYGTSTSLDITGDYTYIGLRSRSNALYLDTIAIVWQTGTNSYDNYSNYSTNCSAKVTVTFHKNDGSDATTTQGISEGKSTALNANPWSRSHYTFEGWATSSNGEKVYDDQQSVTINTDLDLYALWTEDPQYTVTCYSNGVKVFEETGYAGAEISIPNPDACSAYSFVGWSTTPYPTEVTEKPATVIPTTIPASDITYYALFSRQVEGGSTITNDYQKITTSEELTTANYVVAAYYNSTYSAMSTSWKDTYYLAPVEVTPNNQNIIYTTDGTIIWNLTVVGDLVSLTNETAGNLYIEQSEKNNNTYYNIKLGNNTTDNKFTHSVTNEEWLFTSTTYTDRVLEFFTGDKFRWAFYTSADAPVYLYKQIIEDGHITYYVSSPACSGGTVVENIVGSSTPRIVLLNGHIFILRDGKMYNLQGIRVQ